MDCIALVDVEEKNMQLILRKTVSMVVFKYFRCINIQ